MLTGGIATLAAFATMAAGTESARTDAPASIGRSAGAENGSSSHVPPIGVTVALGADADL
jgi:hypothetical protein